MKKIFTLIAATLLCIGASAQKITFTEEDVAAQGETKSSYANGNFSITIVDEQKKMAIDANKAYFGTSADDAVKYEYRLKSGAKTQTAEGKGCQINVTIPAAGALKVYPRTGSNSATDRTLVITQNGSELYNKVVQEADATVVNIEANKSEENPTGETKVYPVISVTVAAGTAEITFPIGSMNFYAFEFAEGETGTSGGEQGGEGGSDDPVTPAGSIDFPTSKDGIAISGTTTFSTVKIHTNADALDCIKFANSYTVDEKLNENYALLTVEGGFKAGDVVSIAGAFNNTDDTKKSAVDIFTVDGTTPTVLFTTQQFINGRTVADEPVVETYTLAADAEKLYIGRNGNTGTNVTLLKVERTGTGIAEQLNLNVKVGGNTYNLAGQKVSENYKGVVIQNGRKMIQK